jgi:putative zinc finger/helix-turn-helix YgiT family protein
MKAFCPNCEKETQQVFEKKTENVDVRGESIPVEFEYFHCDQCHESYEIQRPDYDPLEVAYREYRERRGLLQPEKIKELRKELGLSQKAFSNLLGVGIATLNRYENGALQSEAHDQVIRLTVQPENLIRILKEKPYLLSENETNSLLMHLQKGGDDGADILGKAIDSYGSYSPSTLSGHIRFDVNKFIQAIKFFCFNDKIVKTKLMKLMFYADHKHYKDYGISISGSRYAHANYGPVPDKFDTWLTAITEWSHEVSREEQLFGDYFGEVYTSGQPDLSVFSTSEIASLAYVKEKFAAMNASEIRDFSHNEYGYQVTKNGALISYDFAENLQI